MRFRHKYSVSALLSVPLAFVMVLAACSSSGLSGAQQELAEKLVDATMKDPDEPPADAEEYWAGTACFLESVAGLISDDVITDSGVLEADLDAPVLEKIFSEFDLGTPDYETVGSVFRVCLLDSGTLSRSATSYVFTEEELSDINLLGVDVTEDIVAFSVCLALKLMGSLEDTELGKLLIGVDDEVDAGELEEYFSFLDNAAVGRMLRECGFVAALQAVSPQERAFGEDVSLEVELCIWPELFNALTDEEIGRIFGSEFRGDDSGISSIDAFDVGNEDDVTLSIKVLQVLETCLEAENS